MPTGVGVIAYPHRMDDTGTPRFAALLRGINVGGVTIKMADLRRVFAEQGFEEVRTVLASGNVLFDVPADSGHAPDPATLRSRIETALGGEFGYDARVFVLDVATLRSIVAAYPFDPEQPGRHPYVVFVSDPGALEALASGRDRLDPAVERIETGDGVLYWEVERGKTLESTLGKRTAAAKIKSHTTTRNLRTLTRMLS
ncbi:Uncharacterized conserved protein, DUF1697 family [Rhodococcus triatomae]|uniref:Uncharacterized conserved protein, DUF1697 family n=2 Tax=Rhodococcus triatomae TaxID=300028 RepID=A0A1G8DAX7_9NOCA|nr:Uncharacterized conserved protein, DUF1697 family [Rhodococcus triatomae]